MKKIAMMLGLMFLVSMAMVDARTAPATYTDAKSAPVPYVDARTNPAPGGSPSVSVSAPSKSGGGGALITKYANIDRECVKRDVMSIPTLIKTKENYKLQPQYFILQNPAPEGYAWLVRIIPAKYAIVLNDNGIGLKTSCEDESSDASPILIW